MIISYLNFSDYYSRNNDIRSTVHVETNQCLCYRLLMINAYSAVLAYFQPWMLKIHPEFYK